MAIVATSKHGSEATVFAYLVLSIFFVQNDPGKVSPLRTAKEMINCVKMKNGNMGPSKNGSKTTNVNIVSK